ncbi:MAG: ATP-binding protein [Clostridiales bacterium]|nr:ATP-binding protein [Clostridiales bacterium]
MKKKINLRLIGMSIAAVIITMVCVTFVFYGLFQKQVRADLRTNAEILKMTGLFTEDGLSEELSEHDENDADLDDAEASGNTEEINSDSLREAEAGENTENIDSASSQNTEIEEDSKMLDALESGLSYLDSLRITWVSADGTVLYDNDASANQLENHLDRPEIVEALETGEGESVRRSSTMNMNTIYYAVLLEDGSVLRLSADVRSIFSVFVTAFPAIILIVVIIILLCALIARFLTRKLLAPIDQLAEHIEDATHTLVYKELIPFVNTIRSQHENILSAARSRQDFTANVSHELKTPLTAISGYAELIENHMVDQEQEAKFAGKIRQNADRLVTLINDIIRLSELDQGGDTQIVFEELDLFEAARDRVDLLMVSAESRNIRLNLQGESCMVRANRNMITELIDNLCQNAIRYNNPGGMVTVTVRRAEENTELMVADTGIGIPRDLQERVFERFYRVDKSRSKETGGTGLGLAIVKHIVELHGAEISLASEIGKGTTITVEF